METRPSTIRFRNPYNETENREYDELTMTECKDESLTLQAPAEEQDINVIMKRFGVKDGSRLPKWEDPRQIYGDFSDMPTDPVAAAEYLRQGELAFNVLPADVRTRFASGAELYQWMRNPKNTEEAQKLGLLATPAPKPNKPEPVRVIIDTPEKPETPAPVATN